MFLNRLILTLCFCLIALPCFSAEFLVQAKPHWMDELNQVEVNKMQDINKQAYNRRAQVGDIISVKPNGWEWGKEEGLPNYVVVRVPDMTYKDTKQYEKRLIEVDGKNKVVIRKRKYSFSSSEVETAKVGNLDAIQVNKATFESYLKTKKGDADEVSKPKADLFSYLNYYSEPIKVVLNIAFNKPAYALSELLKTVKPSGGDYTSLESCMNANEQNLVANDKFFNVEIDDTWSSPDTTHVDIHNYVSDATRNIHIFTTATARHDGTASTGYRLFIDGDEGILLFGYNIWVEIEGLIVEVTEDNGMNFNGTAEAVTVHHNIVKMSSPAPYTYDKAGISATKNTFSYNNIVYGFTTTSKSNASTGIENGHAYGDAYNNTVYGCDVGIGGYVTAKNNISVNNNDADYSGTFNAASTHNLASDTTAPEFNTFYDSKTITFVSTTTDSEDFHLASVDTDAIDLGTSLSGDFTDDIDGDTRPQGSAWDMGADEYVSGVTYCPPTCTGTGISIYGNNSIYGNITIY